MQNKKQRDILNSLLFSVAQFIIIYLFFEPTEKCDDYDMCNVLYGGHTGVYDEHLLYVSVLIGKLLKCLLTVFPNIPWYYVYMTAVSFVSFWVLNYLYVSNRMIPCWIDIEAVVIAFFLAYEFYIRFTFTKIAGLCDVAGLMLLTHNLYGQSRKSSYAVAAFCIINGVLIRSSVVLVVIAVFFSTYIIFFVEQLYKKQALNRSNIKKTVQILLSLIAVLFLFRSVSLIENITYKKSDTWKTFFGENNQRSDLFDYGIPSYEKYQKEYEALSVSKNDYKMWFQDCNYYDTNVFNAELIQKIKSIEPVKQRNLFKEILRSLKSLPTYATKNILFCIFLMSFLLFLVGTKSRSYWKLVPISSMMFISYILMFVRGRVQHHVDVVLYLAGISLFFYYMDIKRNDGNLKRKRVHLVFAMLSVVIVARFYPALTNSAYNQDRYGTETSFREKKDENYKKLKLLSEDKGSLYLLGALETTELYPAFKIDSVIEKNFYNNILMLNSYIPTMHASVESYLGKGDNLFEHIVNNENIFYCVCDEKLDVSDTIATYLSEHYAFGTEAKLVKNVNGMQVYRFVDRPPVFERECLSTDNIITNVEAQEKGADKILLHGYVFMDGTDSFAQNVYINVKGENKEKSYFTLQSNCNEYKFKGKNHGEYAGFSVVLDKEDLSSAETVNVILDVDGRYYKKSLIL